MSTTKNRTVEATEPADFDFDAWLSGVKPATFTAPLYRRADLIGRIEELAGKIRAAGKSEFSMADGDPMTTAVLEHNKLVEQFEASREDFTFRPRHADDQAAVLAAIKADGLTVNDEAAAAYMMARTCVSHPLTGAQMQRLRETVGEVAFGILADAWNKAWSAGGERDAPFSPLPLPTPSGGESS